MRLKPSVREYLELPPQHDGRRRWTHLALVAAFAAGVFIVLVLAAVVETARANAIPAPPFQALTTIPAPRNIRLHNEGCGNWDVTWTLRAGYAYNVISSWDQNADEHDEYLARLTLYPKVLFDVFSARYIYVQACSVGGMGGGCGVWGYGGMAIWLPGGCWSPALDDEQLVYLHQGEGP